MTLKSIWLIAAIVLYGSGILFGRSYLSDLFFDSPKLVHTETKKTTTMVSTEAFQKISEVLSAQITQDEFQKEWAILQSFRNGGTLQELLTEGEKIEMQWGSLGGNQYGELSLEFLSVLSSNRFSTEVKDICRPLATRALAKADSYDLSIEWHLLLFLGVVDSHSTRLSEMEIFDRHKGTQLWLHAIRRLEITKDKNFNPNDPPPLNAQPPPGSGFPAGTDPEAIKDARIRIEYERRITAVAERIKHFNQQLTILRQEKFFVELGVEYIANAYLAPPQNKNELNNLLAKYNISTEVQKKLKSRINDAVQ